MGIRSNFCEKLAYSVSRSSMESTSSRELMVPKFRGRMCFYYDDDEIKIIGVECGMSKCSRQSPFGLITVSHCSCHSFPYIDVLVQKLGDDWLYSAPRYCHSRESSYAVSCRRRLRPAIAIPSSATRESAPISTPHSHPRPRAGSTITCRVSPAIAYPGLWYIVFTHPSQNRGVFAWPSLYYQT